MIPTDKYIEEAQRKENTWQCYNNVVRKINNIQHCKEHTIFIANIMSRLLPFKVCKNITSMARLIAVLCIFSLLNNTKNTPQLPLDRFIVNVMIFML